jgi:tight adherence protein B
MIQREEGEEAPGVLVKKAPKTFPIFSSYLDWLAVKLERARLLYRPYEYFLLALGTALLSALLMFLAVRHSFQVMGWGAVEYIFMVMAGGITGFIIPHVYLSMREGKQRHLLNSQVGDMIMLLGNYLRAGHSFTRAMQFISREAPPPMADELKRFAKDATLGRSIEEALTGLEKRTGDKDLAMVITAIRIQHDVGGNLAEILDKINHTIRERVRLRGEARTLTTQGRLTGVIISVLPVVVGLIIFLLHPDFIRILFVSFEGRIMLLMALFAELTGVLVIRRMLDIEV